MQPPYDTVIACLGNPREMKIWCTKKAITCFIHNSLKLKTTACPLTGGWSSQRVHPHHGILLRSKRMLMTA